MKIVKHTIETKADPKAIWRLWEDVENWPRWDNGLEFSKIEGPFIAGTRGTLKPKGGPLVKTLLVEVSPLKSFVDEATLPFTKIIVSHSLCQKEGKTFVTHEVEMRGVLAPFFAFVIGRKMKKNMPHEMENMVKMAEIDG